MGSSFGYLPHVQDPLQVEAMACLQSMQAAQLWGLTEVHVESDSLLLVQVLKSSDQDHAVNGILFREIKCFARLNFSSSTCSFCPRIYNKLADALANFGASSGLASPAVWLDGAPDFVRGIVASDIAELYG